MSQQEKLMSIHDIMEILPHRFPFLLIDSIVSVNEDKSGVALKNVTMNEPFFVGHFPGEPVMPGILLVEGMLQTACVVAHHLGLNISKERYLLGVDQVRFRQPVLPGDQVHFYVQFIEKGDKGWECKATAKVGDAVSADAHLFL